MQNIIVRHSVANGVIVPIIDRMQELVPKVLGKGVWDRNGKLSEYLVIWEEVNDILDLDLDLPSTGDMLLQVGDKLLYLFQLLGADGFIPRDSTESNAMLLQLCCLRNPDTIPDLIKAHVWLQSPKPKADPTKPLVISFAPHNADIPCPCVYDMMLTPEHTEWLANPFYFLGIMDRAGALNPVIHYSKKVQDAMTVRRNINAAALLHENARHGYGDEKEVQPMLCIEDRLWDEGADWSLQLQF